LYSDTAYFATAIPRGDACTSGGASWLYAVDLLDGTASGELYSENVLIVGLTAVELATDSGSSGEVKIGIISNQSDGGLGVKIVNDKKAGGSVLQHRTSWRELAN
jgi:type IV pilus assembly protein PilY1